MLACAKQCPDLAGAKDGHSRRARGRSADGKTCSSPSVRRKSTLKKLDTALRLHMKIEEQDVYPLVARLLGKDEAQEANIEHGLARDGLDKLEDLVDQPGSGAAVAMLTAGIKHHVKEEEHGMFPDLKRKLDRRDLLALGDEVAAAKKKAR
jgi:hemerythrin-like domain-containing protein